MWKVTVVDLGAALRHERLQCAVEWRPKRVTTRSPIVGTHEEWALYFNFSCATEILLAVVLRVGSKGSFGRLGGQAAATHSEARLAITPYAWHESDDVQVSLFQRGTSWSDGVRFAVTDPALKRDPREVVEIAPKSGAEFTTGFAYELARAPSVGLAAYAAVLDRRDTISRRGRWRLRPALATDVPSAYTFLLIGDRGGQSS